MEQELKRRIKVIDEIYVMALKHARDRLEINLMAGVDKDTILKEFNDWIEEKENGCS